MQAFIRGHQLIRQNFYLSDKDGISNIKQVDEHEMIFESSYEGWYILEHTRLIDGIIIDIELYILGKTMN